MPETVMVPTGVNNSTQAMIDKAVRPIKNDVAVLKAQLDRIEAMLKEANKAKAAK